MTQKIKKMLLVSLFALPFIAGFHFYIMPHFRILAPSLFGLQHISSRIYVERSMTLGQKWMTYKRIKNARNSIQDIFGSLQSNPNILACVSKLCYYRFGGTSQPVQYPTNNIIRLTQSDIEDRYAISYKLAKLELNTRLGDEKESHSIPVWFKEGLATYLAGNPRFGKLAWFEYIRSSPKNRDIQRFDTFQSWQKAERNKIPVKILARQEFARWFDETGQVGLLTLIKDVQVGKSFKKSFAKQMQITLK